MDEKKQKQIEEMAKVLCCDYNENCYKDCCRSHDCYVEEDCRTLYNAGYRKQKEGEWLKYPHNSGIYCSLCKRKRRYRDMHDAYCPNCGAHMRKEDEGK